MSDGTVGWDGKLGLRDRHMGHPMQWDGIGHTASRSDLQMGLTVSS